MTRLIHSSPYRINITNRVHTFSNFCQSLLQLGCCCVRLLSRLRVSVAVAVGEADEKLVKPKPNLVDMCWKSFFFLNNLQICQRTNLPKKQHQFLDIERILNGIILTSLKMTAKTLLLLKLFTEQVMKRVISFVPAAAKMASRERLATT